MLAGADRRSHYNQQGTLSPQHPSLNLPKTMSYVRMRPQPLLQSPHPTKRKNVSLNRFHETVSITPTPIPPGSMLRRLTAQCAPWPRANALPPTPPTLLQSRSAYRHCLPPMWPGNIAARRTGAREQDLTAQKPCYARRQGKAHGRVPGTRKR